MSTERPTPSSPPASSGSWWERPAPRLTAFAVALAVLFGVGAALGAVAGPDDVPAQAAASASAAGHAVSGGRRGADSGGAYSSAGDTDGAAAGGVGSSPVEGLEVSREGYTLETLAAPTTAGVQGELAFRVLGRSGTAVTAFTPTHDKTLHPIVVRRDQSGFAHLHPVMDPAGVWRIPLTLAAGEYRLFADFAPDGRSEALTLGRDLPVAGDYESVALPAPSTRASTPDGYTVTLAGTLTAGASSPLTLTVAKGGAPVTDLQPYRAAYGHLVALRNGDLAYLHVHPDGAPGDGRTPPGPGIGFAAEVPTPGAYRLYLDFAHQGVVRTVELTALARPAPITPVAKTVPVPNPGIGAGPASAPLGHRPTPLPRAFPELRID